MQIEFTAHNIRLDDGTFTKPEIGFSMETDPRFVSARRVLETVFPGDKSQIRIADLGCLEGGYTVEFARMGFQALGLEVRDANIAACRYVKSKTNLPNLEFVQDDAWNIGKYGIFDACFCCGLLYHFDKPKKYLEMLSAITSKLLILNTHFSAATDGIRNYVPRRLNKALTKIFKYYPSSAEIFNLSPITENESLPGRWYMEFGSDASFRDREHTKWSSWDNRRSFWIQREYLLQTIQDVGFDMVMEQFDVFAPNIADSLLHEYKSQSRGLFIGIKTQATGVAGQQS